MAGPPPPASDTITRVGRYEVLGEIASGGMATVYLARAVGAAGFARLVAIKKLHDHLQSDEEFVAMLLDEARLAARIRHPNVVPVVDMEASPSLYLVMEYIEGDKLSGLIKALAKAQKRMPPSVAIRVIHDSLSGLHVAHELCDEESRPLKIIHRDISPQNILVGVDGVSRITDFGIAKAESRATATREGELKGKVGYMAPEQLTSAEIDRRVDLFAMGVTLWEALAGRRLFYRDTEVESMAAVAHAPIPSLTSPPIGLPRELDLVVQRALSRDPAARFATARQFADALEQAARWVGGIATTRDVADLVETVAGEKIASERKRMREAAAFTNSTPISQQFPVGSVPLPSTPLASVAVMPATPAMPRDPLGPGEASVPSGVQIGRSAPVSLPPGRLRASSLKWIVVAAVGAVIAASLLTALVMVKLRSPNQTASSQVSQTTTTPTQLRNPPVPSLPQTVPFVPDASTTALIAPTQTNDERRDAGAFVNVASDAGTRNAAAPVRGHPGGRRRNNREDDSDFIGVNPYMH